MPHSHPPFFHVPPFPRKYFISVAFHARLGSGGEGGRRRLGGSIEIQLENTSHDIKHENGKWRRGARKFFNYAKNILNRSLRVEQARGRLVGCRVWKQLARLRVTLDSFDLLKNLSKQILELATPQSRICARNSAVNPLALSVISASYSNRLSRTLKPSKSGAPVEEVQSLSLKKLLLLLIRECRGLLLCCW